ncbi:FeoB small GTPase domain-containing protein [Caldisalinibacter kiritimatiensis]|uniref:Ferrous iron transport protein B n=1 Tax=Caldisalinibacter kiritimatiensis TaxID=1304284 RepID=R1CWQ3_9FIRM|nr:FeoB small GTPase domain-containing protein [Caldisalinibacter kiritimatiensis]EOD01044.1 Ferrous iron transport protein B [Caldisalinibacter kiritimatiensis]
MGLTSQSTGIALLKNKFAIEKKHKDQIVIGLAGNPNTGKSTLFNNLTGLNQHTGNWPGKTVTNAKGSFSHKDKEFLLVDLPGTYSLLANSVEEEVARDFICFGNPEITIVITDATCLERNLNLALQVMEITDNVIVCLNLMDEAKRKGISINIDTLEKKLGVPVIPTVARDGIGTEELKETMYKMVKGEIKTKPLRLSYNDKIENLVKKIEPKLKDTLGDSFNTRWLALRLIDGDKAIIDSIKEILNINKFNEVEV